MLIILRGKNMTLIYLINRIIGDEILTISLIEIFDA